MATKIPLAFFLAISVFFILPIAFLVYGSFVPAINSHAFTTSFIVQAFTSPRTWPLLVNTLEYGLVSAAIAVAIAAVYAWLLARTDIPGKSFLKFLPLFPLTLPMVVKAFAWIFLFSPTIGLVNNAIKTVTGIQFPVFNIYSMAGLIFANAAGGIPLAFLMIEASLLSMDSALEDASRTTGGGGIATVSRVTLPLLTPAIVSVFILEALIGVESFDYPFILGRNQIPTLATEVYNLVNVTYNYALASAYGIMFLIMTIVLITLYLWYVRKSFKFVTVTGKASRPTLFRLGQWKWPALLFCAAAMLVAFFLPFATIILVSLVPFYTVAPGYNTFAVLTLNNYVKAIHQPLFLQATINSFELAIGAGVLTTLIAAVMSYLLVKNRSRSKVVFDYLSLLPLSFPGVVYALGLIWTFLVIPGLNGIYGTTWVMLIALIVVWLPYSIRFMTNSLLQVADELEEAASVAGSTWLRRFPRVTLPLLRSGFANSLVYVMADSFRELGAVVLLSNAGSITLTVLILDLFENTASALPTVAALSTLMTIMISFLIVIPRVIFRQRVRV
ncbi:MAG TPA: iron ABC transporter permease [Nitrososphaerales archaeon]|nr:iron ABC transporter permease [Nitrososphaerales archaeon]